MSTTKYTVEVLAPAVAASESIAGVLRYLGVKQAGGTQAYVSKRIKTLGLDTSHFTGRGHNKGKQSVSRRADSDILRVMPEGSFRTKTAQLKRAMLNAGLDEACALCYNDGTWNGKPLVLDIDHINGEWLDNRLENLRFLCPNCHRQQEDTNRSNKQARVVEWDTRCA